MNPWLEFAVALVVIGAWIAAAIPMINKHVADAQHEAFLDELWADDAVPA